MPKIHSFSRQQPNPSYLLPSQNPKPPRPQPGRGLPLRQSQSTQSFAICLSETHLDRTVPSLKSIAKGKARDVYEGKEHLVLVTTDRQSASDRGSCFDSVHRTVITIKGKDKDGNTRSKVKARASCRRNVHLFKITCIHLTPADIGLLSLTRSASMLVLYLKMFIRSFQGCGSRIIAIFMEIRGANT